MKKYHLTTPRRRGRDCIDALTAMHATNPAAQSPRYRSTANNEELPGYSGAVLDDSRTQHPDETVEDGSDKSNRAL